MAKNKKTAPWERKESETAKNYEAFCIYRDLGPGRSLRLVSEMCGKNESLLSRWSAKFDWVNRAALWDDEQDRIERKEAQEAQAREIRNMRKRHANLAVSMLEKAAKALKTIPDDEVRAGDISRMVDVASKLERISRGDVGEVVEERDGGQAPPAVTFYMPDNGRDKKEEE